MVLLEKSPIVSHHQFLVDFQAINEGRVYALRYELCDDLPRETKDITDDDPERTMWKTLSPIALFVSAKDFVTNRNDLVPVAIQMDYTPGSVSLSKSFITCVAFRLFRSPAPLSSISYIYMVERGPQGPF